MKKICFLPFLCIPQAHMRDICRKANSVSPMLRLPEAGILLWNLLLDACPFDGASYRLWSADSTSGYILQIACALSHPSFTFLSLHINQLWEKASHPPKVPHLTAYFLTLFLPLFWLCFFSPAFFSLSPQTWHKQIELELFNHFSELPTQRGARTISSQDLFELMLRVNF